MGYTTEVGRLAAAGSPARRTFRVTDASGLAACVFAHLLLDVGKRPW